MFSRKHSFKQERLFFLFWKGWMEKFTLVSCLPACGTDKAPGAGIYVPFTDGPKLVMFYILLQLSPGWLTPWRSPCWSFALIGVAMSAKAVTSKHLKQWWIRSVRLDAARLQEGVNSMDNQLSHACLSSVQTKVPCFSRKVCLGRNLCSE